MNATPIARLAGLALTASIAAGPPKRVQTAEVVLPEDGATQQN